MARGFSSSSLLERDVKLELSSLGDRDIVKECGQYEAGGDVRERMSRRSGSSR